MHTDADFLAKLLADPSDNTVRLVYADWLDEQSDPISVAKAEFLRTTVQLATQPGTRGWKKARRKRLQEVAAGLDTDWLGVVSHLAIENCHGKRTQEKVTSLPFRFDFLCDRRWQDLSPTADPSVRFCDACKHNVHYCDTIVEARNHAQAGHCIAVDLGVIRREGDLAPPRMWMGRATPDMVRQERERQQPDPVSVERERRKRGKRKAKGK